ncbi:MAG TPA: xanthine dehydrogenase family protein subunit M [Candidatus Binatia bacterium]|nr:xanthine dehydrogenase family protein subunit M [Candidatus Binatia bacterium]
MHDFQYFRPATVAEAVALLAGQGGDARVLAGGTDLLIQMRAGLRRPARVVDVKRIPDLARLDCDRASGLRIGAAVPCWRVAEDAGVRDVYPGLAEAAALIGSDQIQSRATLAGNLCNASPAADTAPALIALGATCVVAGPSGERTLPAEEVMQAPGRNALAPGELLVEIRVPAPPPRAADCYQRLIPRNEMDIAVVGVGVALAFEGDRCRAARVALGAVGPTPIVAREAAATLVGTPVDDAALAAAAAAATAAASPISDMRAPAEYRREIVGVLVRRVASEAARRARAR